jgi:oxygen-dependent protoporphyrinogen oxidase
LLRVFLGGAGRPEQLDLEDAAITALVERELAGLIGAAGEPLFVQIGRHARTMPQYNLGHLDRVASIRRHLAKYSRLFLAGIAFDGVGIPDCIQAAERTADSLIDALAKPAASAA